MKNQKSNITAFVSAAGLACILLLGGCSQDDAPAPEDGTKDGNAIRFTSTISHFTGDDTPDTRATIDPADGKGSFENGDQILVYATPYTQTSDLFRTATFINGASWECDTPLLWSDLPEDESGYGYTFIGYYPVPTTTPDADGYIVFTVESDQSTQEAYAASDLLISGTTVERGKDVTFRFVHSMARILVTLTAGEGVTQEAVNTATVRIKNMRINSQVNLWYSSISAPPDPVNDDITPLPSATSPGTFYAVVPPLQTLDAGRDWIEVTVDGQTFTYKVPGSDNLTLFQGETTRVNLTLTGSGATAGITTAEELLAAMKTGGTSDNPTKITLGGDITMPKGPGNSVSGTPMTGSGYYKIDGGGHTLSWVTGSEYYLGNIRAADDATYIEITNTRLVYEDSNLAMVCIYNGKITLGEGVTVDGRYNMILANGEKATLELGDGCVLSSSGESLVSVVRNATLVLNGGTTAAGAYIELRNEGPTIPAPVVSIPKALTNDVSLILGFYMNAPEILIAEGTPDYQLTQTDFNRLKPHPTKSAISSNGGKDWLEFEGNFEFYLDEENNQIKLRKKQTP